MIYSFVFTYVLDSCLGQDPSMVKGEGISIISSLIDGVFDGMF